MTCGYYVGTAGNVSENFLEKYITVHEIYINADLPSRYLAYPCNEASLTLFPTTLLTSNLMGNCGIDYVQQTGSFRNEFATDEKK